MGKLEGKIALITGGSSGIGLETAKLFAQEGARVLIIGRNEAALAKAAKAIGRQSLVFKADISRPLELESLNEFISKELGRIDVYFANAGQIILENFEEVSYETFDQQFMTNVRGTHFGVQKTIPFMPEGSSIILTGSIASSKALEGHDVYAATKAAVRSFARSWTYDLKAKKIRVNVLSPGPTDTPIIEKLGVTKEQRSGFDQYMSSLIPVGRLGNPRELAKAALFLASDESSFVSGIELCVDGGMAQI